MKTVLVKRSIEKDGLPKPSVSLITFFPKKEAKLITGKFNGEQFFTIGQSWNPLSVEYYLEEIPLSQLIEEMMPTEIDIDKAFVELEFSNEYQIFKGGIEWFKNKLTSNQ